MRTLTFWRFFPLFSRPGLAVFERWPSFGPLLFTSCLAGLAGGLYMSVPDPKPIEDLSFYHAQMCLSSDISVLGISEWMIPVLVCSSTRPLIKDFPKSVQASESAEQRNCFVHLLP